jgi:hypothetical protein
MFVLGQYLQGIALGEETCMRTGALVLGIIAGLFGIISAVLALSVPVRSSSSPHNCTNAASHSLVSRALVYFLIASSSSGR